MASNQKVLVIGSGGREHAICWKLALSPKVTKIYCVPGLNGSFGIGRINKIEIAKNICIKNFQDVTTFCKSKNIDLVVIGSEEHLASGLSDALYAENIPCFGPCKSGARIEADKSWSKSFMVKYGIPTARYQTFQNADEAKKFIKNAPFKALVVKAAGLAEGKGVTVAKNENEACAAVDEVLRLGKSAEDVVIIEELLSGEEVSILAFTDGKTIKVMLPVQDHKRLLDCDEGPNTGGMGAYCPYRLISDEDLKTVEKQVLQAAVEGLKKEGIKYCGVLYAGVMLTPDGPKTLEFNCRFGDPETEVQMPLLESDLYEIMEACCKQTLEDVTVKWKTGVNAVGVVMANGGYPGPFTKGKVIKGLEAVEQRKNHIVFHNGVSTINENNSLVAMGGRVLTVVVIDPDLKKAASTATQSCGDINFAEAHFRSDIAYKAYKGLTYKDSGVNIDAGDQLVQAIKPMAKSTNRSGVLGGLGGFGGLFQLNEVLYNDKRGIKTSYKDPVLVQITDGVGEKLKIAEKIGCYDTIGVDLVAMCLNEVLSAGAEPLAFLDYIACGKLEVEKTAAIVSGIARACKETGCALLGGETAEMPSMYKPGEHDMAGFCVGVVEHEDILPKCNEIKPGDLVIGLPSNGIHSTGFSLVDRILKSLGYTYEDSAPFSSGGRSFGQELLIPTKLYVSSVLPVIRRGYVKALTHVTRGGLVKNITRMLPHNIRVELDATQWRIPEIFAWLCTMGKLDDEKMLHTFNCGIGMILIISSEDKSKVLDMLKIDGAKVIGTIEAGKSSTPEVFVKNFCDVINQVAAVYKSDKIKHEKISETPVSNYTEISAARHDHRQSTNRPGVIEWSSGELLGGLFRIKDTFYIRNGTETQYKDPVLVMGTDGVGTKLKIAQDLNIHNTIGIDLVAMCANDILCNGAEPLTFLDYYACGKLNSKVHAEVLGGIAEGCNQSESTLIGGETAEMPGMYADGVYDLAGYSLGIVEKAHILPKMELIKPGDVLIGLPSSGVHSNGFSLVHKVIHRAGLTMTDKAPFSRSGKSLGEELLKPTKIYISAVLPALRTGVVKALAHITGGGLTENIPRVLPSGLQVVLDANQWNILPVFAWLSDVGNISDSEMLRAFNCGLGMVLVIPAESEMEVLAQMCGHGATKIGHVQKLTGDDKQVLVKNFKTSITRVSRSIASKKKVAVLISGTGSNLQALIDSSKDSSSGLGVEIVLVISNKPEALGLEKAKRAGIQTKVISHKDYPTRVDYDMVLNEELKRHNVEYVCLAGFMRILSAEFVRIWKGRLLNVHPSLLPKYKGTDGIKQAFESKDTYTGCTVHFVDEGVDTGHIIVQEVVKILPNDTLETLAARIHKAEHQAFPRALRLVSTGAVGLNAEGRLSS